MDLFKSEILKEQVSKQEVLIYVIHLNLILALVMPKWHFPTSLGLALHFHLSILYVCIDTNSVLNWYDNPAIKAAPPKKQEKNLQGHDISWACLEKPKNQTKNHQENNKRNQTLSYLLQYYFKKQN